MPELDDIDRDEECGFCRMPRHAHWGGHSAAAAGRCAGFQSTEVTRIRAAAPALLVSLKELLDACERDCGVPSADDADDEPVGGGLNEDGTLNPMALTFGHLRRAAAAVAKAEGR